MNLTAAERDDRARDPMTAALQTQATTSTGRKMAASSAPINPAAHLPDFTTPANVPGLSGAVDVWRDAWGIPHIKARSFRDAFAGLGFAHAQDRLWQMEALLRRATGRYAEWLGARALPADMIARKMDAAAASRRDIALLSDETKAMLESYAHGVNAFIAVGRWPVEYGILNESPGRWEPWHSIAAMRQIGFLMGSVWWKLWRAAALPIIGPDNIDKLRFDDGGDDFLCMPSGAEGQRLAAALLDLKPGLTALLDISPDAIGAELAGGSNNWALSGQHTSTGRPIVAGDPHRQLEMPNMYAQAHVACEDFDVIGLTVPGVPGFPHFGHTANVAWGVTHAFVDIHDLYVEHFSEHGTHYSFKGEQLPAIQRRETIKVRDADDVSMLVTETRHGPIIIGNPSDGKAVALRSAQFAVPDKSFDCMLPMLRAGSVKQLFEATKGFGLMDHNVVAGDIHGHIGHHVRALVPLRPRANGWLPVPGWSGEYEWNGMVSYADMPNCIDPPSGKIVTANNRIVPGEREPYISTDTMPPHRARRILRRLAQLDKAPPDQMASIHRDTISIPGTEIRERLRQVAPPAGAEDVHRLILGWNGEMKADSRGAAAYAVLRFELTKLAVKQIGLQRAAESPFAKVTPGIVPENQFWGTLPQLLRANDESLLAGATWNGLLQQALSAAALALPDETWGALHTPLLKHQLSASFPEYAAALDKDCATISGDNDTVLASGYAAKNGWRAVSSALSRYVFDVGAWDNCQWIVFHGASGHPASPSYLDQNATWARGELVPMLYNWDAIRRSATSHQVLNGP
jgi:penicillin G amidase